MNNEISGKSFDDELSLADIFLFIANSLPNIIKSIFICALMGGSYYLYAPNTYEATASIQMAQVGGNPVETSTVLLEKIKLPLYFSQTTWSSCEVKEDSASNNNIINKIKPILNKSAQFIVFTVQDKTTEKAKQCLNAILADIQAKQAELAKPIIQQKNRQLEQLNEKLKFAEYSTQVLSPKKLSTTFSNTQFASLALMLSNNFENARVIKDLRNSINDVEISLSEPQTKATYLIAPMYSNEVAVNKRPMLTLLICLLLGGFIGLAITGINRILPTLAMQIKTAKANQLSNG